MSAFLDPRSDFTIAGCVSSAYEHARLAELKLDVSSAADTEISNMSEQIRAAQERLQQHDTFVGKIARSFLQFFGVVTRYGAVERELMSLRDRAIVLDRWNDLFTDDSELMETKAKLADLEPAYQERLAELKANLCATSIQFDDLSQYLKETERMIASLGKYSLFKAFRARFQLRRIATLLDEVEPALQELAARSNGTPAYEQLVPLIAQHADMVERIDAARSKLEAVSEFETPVRAKKLRSAAIGIENGGNSCYLNAALQAISVTPALRDLFDPALNPQQPGSIQADVQQMTKSILDKIQARRRVSADEVNALRSELYALGFVLDTPIVAAGFEIGDAQNTLMALCQVFGGDMGITQPKRLVCSDEEDFTHERPLTDADRSDMAEVQRESICNDPIRVCPYPNEDPLPWILNPRRAPKLEAADMQAMVSSSFATKPADEYWIRHDREDGTAVERRYTNLRWVNSMDRALFPNVLMVEVQQVEGADHVPITNADEIYPCGYDEEGTPIGPRYVLQAVVEHKRAPLHYVATVKRDNDSIEYCNDALVSSSRSMDGIKGSGYIYVRAD